MTNLFFCMMGLFAPSALAWAPVVKNSNQELCRLQASVGGLHGDNSCFLPLKQLDQDYYAPRIVQVRQNLLGAFLPDEKFLFLFLSLYFPQPLFYFIFSWVLIFVFLPQRLPARTPESPERIILPWLPKRSRYRDSGRTILVIPTDRNWEPSPSRAAMWSRVQRIPWFWLPSTRPLVFRCRRS